jgi:uncharacterized membrane protein YphA (DoxX/SURF4 family)
MENSMAQAPPVSLRLDQPAWQAVASWICAILIGGLFLIAGAWKLSDHLGAAARMTQALVPASLSVFTAMFFGMAEVFSGILILIPRYRRWGAWLIGLMLIAFMVYIGVFYDRLLGADCTCFPWVKRAVGPMFFYSDAAMLALAALAGWWARPSEGLRNAVRIAGAVAVLGGAAYGITEMRQTGARAPETLTVDGQTASLQQGKVLLYFYDPECAHCDQAARRMAKHTWNGVKVYGLPSRVPQFGKYFMDSTGLKAGNSPEHDALKKLFPFGDPPYAVALEHGRQKAALSRFDEAEPEATLRQLGFIE